MSVAADAPAVGSGVSGLVAAALPARTGPRVTVLERRHADLAGGDPYGGSTEPDQGLVWRPLPGTRSRRSPRGGCGTSVRAPARGPGLAAAPGYAAAAAPTGGERLPPARIRGPRDAGTRCFTHHLSKV